MCNQYQPRNFTEVRYRSIEKNTCGTPLQMYNVNVGQLYGVNGRAYKINIPSVMTIIRATLLEMN